ncbi:hypothetical protein [Actinomarinicola tropica]|uniref:Uncharacterized protein n=1 Tax=Actinomarinicola tropica TaxID=2789776 RepID=A0A5Q2RIH1_9ACTN|nr:hypothetical protein [Actinomarinicola tropica]QGG93638.1 hypothetical protein GH723_00105 [Actinomarinicola tropica]QGG93640.1 hypothetical protein GH723_00115 [Actinomarinicola tropica]
MSDVRVNPPSVRAYGQSAQEMFGSIRTSLEALVSDAVSVDYYGPNAVAFKTKCGQLATELANALTQDMTKIADAVRSTTSNIAASLGGGPVDIAFNGSTISAPAVPAGDESVGANLPALEGMKSTASSHFSAISEQFSNHLSALQNTDWVGTAKDNAVGAVSGFTSSAQSKVQEANTEMATYIDKQIDEINKANK